MTTTEQRLADALRAILPFAERDVGELTYLACDDDSEDEAMAANADVERAHDALAAYDAQQAMTPADKLTVYPDSSANKTGHAILANGVTVARFVPAEWAPRIVQCVNAHDGLVAALQGVLACGERYRPDMGRDWNHASYGDALDALAAAGVRHA